MLHRHRVHVGISTCPNDTFAFAGLLTGNVGSPNLDFEIELLDIQQLNDRLSNGEFDIAKTSFAAAIEMPDRVILPVGSAIGYGVGPLLLASKPDDRPSSSQQLTLCPGKDTTASMLFELFHAETTRVEQVCFADIMPALQEGRADFGVCIHEGRFTWAESGLHLVQDLGLSWEQRFECPLPLGGLVARANIETWKLKATIDAIRQSLRWAQTHPDLALPTMRRYAQAMNDPVLMQHVDLYVNEQTVDLDVSARDALQRLFGLRGKTATFAQTIID